MEQNIITVYGRQKNITRRIHTASCFATLQTYLQKLAVEAGEQVGSAAGAGGSGAGAAEEEEECYRPFTFSSPAYASPAYPSPATGAAAAAADSPALRSAHKAALAAFGSAQPRFGSAHKPPAGAVTGL